MAFTLPELPYKYDALEPFIDAKTMEIHHSKHHQTYVTKLNEAIAKHPELESKTLNELLENIKDIPEDIKKAVTNHGGGHFNHSLFWNTMSPTPVKLYSGFVFEKINETFGSYEKFQEQFSTNAMNLFGSGWTWLVEDNGELKIVNYPNQDCPLMYGQNPIIGLDVWEHAYYLKHQNKRVDYINNWWSVLDWKLYNE